MEKNFEKNTEANKRKIFISAHPADRYEWLERVVKTVEATGVCTPLYNHAPSDTDKELPEGVEVLIILASVKYFTWSNSGYASEYAAAVREGIRILPILIEGNQNTVDLVNMRLGKIQYIDATESADFAMSALHAHLTATEREVDRSLPSVFISYRKKDKDSLDALVSQIGKFAGSDRVNVWYDLIISPGENYSQSIMRELRECDLFVLLVTPSILETGNYVHRVEYKEAKELGKRIIAVEAKKTDRAALSKMYEALPRCVALKQSGALYSVLAELIEIKLKNRKS